MTGIAIYERDSARFTSFEHKQPEAMASVWTLCSAWRENLAIGWERFTIGQKTAKITRAGANTAIEVIGVCKWSAQAWGCTRLPEAQQTTPSAAEQAALRALGWWKPGADDAQSAAAHMLRWMLRTSQAPPAVYAAVQGQGEG
jgi:hypothetical protein